MIIVNLKISHHLFILSCLALPGVLAGCGSGGEESDSSRQAAKETIEKDAKAARGQLDQLKVITLKNSELAGPDAKGRPLWRVAAREIRVFNEAGKGEKGGDEKSALMNTPKRAQLTGATAILFREGKPDSSFRAPLMTLVQSDKGVRLSMSGGVRVQSRGTWSASRGPVVITSPRAEVDIKARRIWAGKGVRLAQGIKGRQIFAAADQMRADTNLKTTLLSGGVRASGAPGNFSANEAIWNWQTDRAFAKGKIKATHAKMTITGARLNADVRAGRGVLSGGVQATGEQGKATAQNVRYDWKAGTVNAGGGVLLTKDEVKIRAGQISADDKFNRATASGDVLLSKGDATLRAQRVSTSGKGAQATASGGVLLTRGGATVSAGEATAYDLGGKSPRVVASGGVTVKREGATVSASRATAYDVGEKSARVEAEGDVRVEREGVTITAGRALATGLGDKNTLRVVASRGVSATNKDGKVSAGSATYGGGKLVASDGVTLRKDGHRLSGSRLTSDDKFTFATLSGDVNGRLTGGETIGAGVLVYRKGAGIEGRGGVSARRGVLRLRADNMTASPDGNSILLKGNVVVTNDEGATIRSGQARYDRRAEKVFASGAVYFQDPKRGLKQRGRGLVADLRLKEATLTGVSGSGKMDVFKDKKIFD